MGSTSRFVLWAAMGLLLAGLFFALLALVTSGARAPSVEAPPSPPPAAAQSDASPEEPVATGIEPADVAPPELLATADELQAQYESRKDEIPEELSEPLDEEIGVIEGAVASLLAAIAAEPENDSLKRMLVATYRNEVRLLKKALHISSETEEAEDVLE